MPVIAIRADSSYEIGIGHVMRCITLASEIRRQLNARVIFISRKADGSAIHKIKAAGFEYVELNSGVDCSSSNLKHGHWLRASQEQDVVEVKSVLDKLNIKFLDLMIVDHYGIDIEWHRLAKSFSKQLSVIDDLGDRQLDCHFLLDQTFNCDKNKYASKVNSDCKMMLGTDFALLRSEFRGLPIVQHSRAKLLVMFGGTDPDNLTLQALRATHKLPSIDEIIVVLSDTAKHLEQVTEFCNSQKNVSLQISPKNIAQLMSESTLAIGAAGTTSWERCAAGLPAVVVVQALNQREIASNLKKAGVLTFIEASDIESSLLKETVIWLDKLKDSDITRIKCQKICDGAGASRVVKEIFGD